MSDFGSLSQCMVDSDDGAKARARRSRRKALALSLIFEFAVVSGLVVWPLMTVAVLPSQAVVTPLPPFHGIPQTQPQVQTVGGSTRPILPNVTILMQPPTIPRHISAESDPQPPGIGANSPFEGDPDFLAGGSESGPGIHIARPPQPPTQTRTVVRNASVMEAMLVQRVQPEYPIPAKSLGISGTVILHARIGTDGEVHEVELVSGNALLAHAAIVAVRQWKYRPTMLNGQPVEVETQVTVNFVLNRD
jgi:protein TonB